jgi:hypothetical protein
MSVKVTKTARVSLAYRALRPDWPGKERLALTRLRQGGVAEVVREGVVWDTDRVAWQAAPGEYELRTAAKSSP